eukprot:gene6017-7497_t
MAFGKAKKYKKIVKAIFPSSPGGEMQLHNISKLVYFCEMNPEQLQKVGPYIQSKAEKNLSKKRLDYVTTCMIIVRELIIGCRKHLLFFSSNATRLMKLLLNQDDHPDLQIEATETFIRFSSVQDDASQFPDIENFIQYFINMSSNLKNDDIKKRRIRGEGLRGISAYISILDLVDELDTFVTRHRLASECLRDLARRVDNITVISLVESVVNYLDSHQKWSSDSFATECLTCISESIKPQHYTIMLTSFLRHLEQPHPPSITKEIVLTSVSIVDDSRGSVNLVVSPLLKALVASIEISNRHPPDVDEQIKLQSIIIESIGSIGKKIKSSRSKMETMNHIMNHLREAHKNHTEGLNLIILDLIQCILQVSSTLTDIIPSNILNELVQKLLDFSKDTSPEVRIYIQKILHSLLLPGGGGSTSKHFDQLLASPQGTLVILLYRGRNAELLNSIPMIFELQSHIKHKEFPFRLARSIQLAICAYLLIVSKVYAKPELEQYINSLLESSKKTCCRYLSIDQTHGLVIKKTKNTLYREREKSKDLTDLLDQDKVAEILCSIPALSRDIPDLKKILSKKYSTLQQRNDFELPQDESISGEILSPSLKNLPLFGVASTDGNASAAGGLNNSALVNSINNIGSTGGQNDGSLSNSLVMTPPKTLTFESNFKQFTTNYQQHQHHNQSPANHSTSVSASNPNQNNPNQNNTLKDNSNKRGSISGTNLLSKDLTYQHVASGCEESQTIIKTEYKLLMDIVGESEKIGKLQIHSQQQLQQQQQSLNPFQSSIHPSPILNNEINPDELSPSCTLKMNIQSVLERVF